MDIFLGLAWSSVVHKTIRLLQRSVPKNERNWIWGAISQSVISVMLYCDCAAKYGYYLDFIHFNQPFWRRKWQPTLVFFPGESHGQRNLVGYSPWGCKESGMTELLTHTHTQPICTARVYTMCLDYFFWHHKYHLSMRSEGFKLSGWQKTP